MSEFVREPRYIVFKISDVLEHCCEKDIAKLQYIGEHIAAGRSARGKAPFNAVVVEQDWPEFDMVWAAIEERVKKGE